MPAMIRRANANSSGLLELRVRSGTFGPGNFGYLTPTTGTLPIEACGPPTGAGIGQAMAASRPTTCLKLSGVDIQPANDQVAMDGLNTRFDIYANGFQSCKDNYVADVNVRKGYVTLGNANWCNAKPSGTNWPIADAFAAALPVDQNMIARPKRRGQWLIRQFDTEHVALGNGTWDCAGYWRWRILRDQVRICLRRAAPAPPRSVDIASTNTRWTTSATGRPARRLGTLSAIPWALNTGAFLMRRSSIAAVAPSR